MSGVGTSGPVFVSCDSSDIIFWTNDSWSPPTVLSTISNNDIQFNWEEDGNLDSSRNTTVNGSSIVIPFEGVGLTVYGVNHPGQDAIAVSYQLDGALFHESVPPNEDSFPTVNYQYFSSFGLEQGRHILIIKIMEVQSTRAYDFQGFLYVNDTFSPSFDDTDISFSQKTHTGIIVGTIVGGVLGILLLLFGIFFVRRMRSKLQVSHHESYNDNIIISDIKQTTINPHSDNSLRASGEDITLAIRRPIVELSTQALRKKKVEKDSLPSLPRNAASSEVITIYDGTGSPDGTIYDPFYSHRKSTTSSSL